MALTPSTMLPLGTTAPDFELTDAVTGGAVTLGSLRGDALVVAFICNHCPYVKFVADELARISRDYEGKSFAMVGISSNDIAHYPADSPEKMAAEAKARGYRFAYLFDETQSVAKAYAAACTPDFYLFDEDRELVYRGQLDDARPGGQTAVTGKDLRAAIDAVLAGETVSPDQKTSIGCNIKWKPGNEPAYVG